MIRMIQSTSSDHAKAYFVDALTKADYYTNDQEMNGAFNGKLAERLGLSGPATKEGFFALADNKHPLTGKNLTPRTKEDRTTGYDINFHCPKSLSALHVTAKDNHILDAFRASVHETMLDIEADSKTRVREKGMYDDRPTGELIWADFIHQTARPVGDHLPDFHLHAHCFVFNATWDETEKKVKAAKFRDIKRDMPYYQARFHKRLSDKMMSLGYQIRRTDKSFEIEGVPQEIINHFSKRTDEIGRVAKEKGITNKKDLDALGARTRSKKQKGLSMAALKTEWLKQMREISITVDSDITKPIRHHPDKEITDLDAKDCIDYAIAHNFERASVMADRRLVESAYRKSIGHAEVSVDDIANEFEEDSRILRIMQGDRTFCTTREVLREEQHMVKLAQAGRGKLAPLYKVAPALTLKDEQAAAVNHVLTTSDRVSIIRGVAGAGKTTLMTEAVKLIRKAGKEVIVVAPTAQASRVVLKEEGFDKAETIAKLLIDQSLQDQLEDQVLWVDEAGLLGTKDMTALLELATAKRARLILGGDTRQHSSVARGDALRILNTVGNIRAAEVSTIYRQKNVPYREAVENLSQGDVQSAFEKLDGIGAIKTIDPEKPNDGLVDDYIKAVKKRKSALVISPTHKQGEEVTEEIRKALRRNKMIGKKEIEVSKLTNLNLTDAQKSDCRNYKKGQVLQFNQNLKGIKRASTWAIQDYNRIELFIKNEHGREASVPISHAKHFDVYDKRAIQLSKGDQVRITRNGTDAKQKRLNNGMMLKVISVSKKGEIILGNKKGQPTYQLDHDFGHIAHAYCITSHASQGKSVDEVFISQPSSTFSATDMKQFYVSVSRGRNNVTIYTDDKTALLESASRMGDRQSALELVSGRKSQTQHIADKQRSDYATPEPSREKPVRTYEPNKTLDYDYEPEL